MAYSTGYTDIDPLLAALRAGIHAVLGDGLVGLYLYGSLVTGDFDHTVSDLDLLAVVAADVNNATFASLHRMQQDFVAANPAWNERIEIAYLAAAALKTFRTEASQIAIVSPGEPFHFKEAGADWLINWWVVRNQGVALYGPPPAAVIDPIGDEEFLRAVQAQVAEWQTWVYHMPERKSQAYTILTMCHALYAYNNRQQASKLRAAQWAIEQYPDWAPLIRNALAWRVAADDPEDDPATTFPDVVAFVGFAFYAMGGN